MLYRYVQSNWIVSRLAASVVGLFVAFAFNTAGASNKHLTYQGRILDTLGQPLEYQYTQFIFEIVSPDGTCVLYKETTSPIDLRNSNGVFDVSIGNHTVDSGVASGITIETVFQNEKPFTCIGGGSYNAVNGHNRKLRVSFKDSVGWRLITPDQEIRGVPYATYAQNSASALRLGTSSESDFLKIANVPICAPGSFLRHISPAGTFVCETPSVPATNVVGDISGNSSGFTGSLSGDVSGSQGSTSVNKIKGVPVDLAGASDGKILKYQAGNFVLADETITSVSGNDITSGTIGGSTSINTSGLIQTSNGYRIYQGANYVELKAPASLAGSYSMRLPTATGSAGQVLKTDASGNLYWDNDLGITGNILASQMNFTGSNTATSTLVVKDASGKFTDFACATAGHIATWTVTGWSCQAAPTGADNLGNHTASQNVRLNSKYLSNDGDNEGLAIDNQGNVSVSRLRTSSIEVDSDFNTGFTSLDDQIDFFVGGANKLRLWSGALDTNTTNTFSLRFAPGTAAAPSYSFTGQSNTGLFPAATNVIGFSTNGAEKMRLDENGNVGIGTSSPSAKLEVNGLIHSTLGGIKFPDGTVQTTAASGGGGGTNGFGSWTSGYSLGTIYQASTDGLVIARMYGSSHGGLRGFTDSNSNPTTERLTNFSYAGAGGNSSITMPVKAGDYWKVISDYSVNTSSIYWVPVSSGGNSVWQLNAGKLTYNGGNVGLGTANPTEVLEVVGNIKGTQLCIGSDCRSSWPAAGAGTVTSVSSSNAYLSVATGTSTPTITANVGTSANTLAAGNDSRFSDSRTPTGSAGGDLSGTYPNPTVAKIRGFNVASTTPLDGQVYKYVSANSQFEPVHFGIDDLRTAIGTNQFAAGACSANQTLNWSAITDAFSCANISGLDAAAVSSGTINSARLPASANAWTVSGSDVYRSVGNVGLGMTSPTYKLDIVGTGWNDSSIRLHRYGAHNSSPGFVTVKNRGTSDTNFAAVQNGDVLGTYSSSGIVDAAGTEVSAGQIQLVTESNWSTGTTPGSMLFKINDGNDTSVITERMRLTSVGRLGLGTSAPTNKLHVYDTVNTPLKLEATTSNVYMNFNSNSTSRGYFGYYVGGSNGMAITNGAGTVVNFLVTEAGKVGIGTTSPAAALHLNPTITGAGPASSGTTPSTGLVTRLANNGGATLDHGMLTNGTQWLQATNTSNQTTVYPIAINPNGGDVGIGTTTPAAALEIKKTFGNGEHIRLTDTYDANSFGTIGYSPYGNNLILSSGSYWNGSDWQATQTGASHLAISPSGFAFKKSTGLSVGGTDPLTNFMIVGGVNNRVDIYPQLTTDEGGEIALLAAGNTGSTNNFVIDNYRDRLRFIAAGTEHMALTSAGSLGIGTSTPSYKLHVNGSVAGTSAYNNLSDARLKKNIHRIPASLAKIEQIDGVSYDWRNDEFPQYDLSHRREIGVIAQTVEKVFPEAVSVDKNTGIKSVAYSMLIAPIIEAIKELNNKVKAKADSSELNALKEKSSALEKENRQLKQQLSDFELRLQRLEKTKTTNR